MIGRCPTGMIGFGRASECSRSRMPIPPQNNTTFTAMAPFRSGCARLAHYQFGPPDDGSWKPRNRGNGHHQPAPPFADVGELRHDLVLQVPRQNENIVRTGLTNPFRWKDRNMRPREKLEVLVRVAIDGVVDEVCTNAAVVEQRVALSWRPISYDCFSFLLRAD